MPNHPINSIYFQPLPLSQVLIRKHDLRINHRISLWWELLRRMVQVNGTQKQGNPIRTDLQHWRLHELTLGKGQGVLTLVPCDSNSSKVSKTTMRLINNWVNLEFSSHPLCFTDAFPGLIIQASMGVGAFWKTQRQGMEGVSASHRTSEVLKVDLLP